MSKRNKRKNKHQFQSAKKGEGQSSEGVVESKPITLDEHLDDLALQSIKVPSTDMVEPAIAKADDVAPEEDKKEPAKLSASDESETKADKEKTTVVEVSEAVGDQSSHKAVKAFIVGLLVGAAIISILF